MDLNRFSPSLVVEIKDGHLLFDCGRGVCTQLMRVGINPASINHLFITHHHYDHISDYGDFVLVSWISGRSTPLKVFGPRGTKHITDLLFRQVYKTDIESRLRSGSVKSWLDIDVKEVGKGLVLTSDGWTVTSNFVDHWRTRFPDFKVDSLAFRIDSQEGSVVFSGDTMPCKEIVDLSKGADLLIHECYLTDDESEDARRRGVTYGHTTSSQLGRIARDASVKKLVLTHFRPNRTLELLEMMKRDVEKTFNGEVVLGEDLMQLELQVD